MDEIVAKTTLDNGVRILTSRIPHVHSISMGVWVNVGARDESAAESGLSHFIEHMIFKGTRKRTAFDIAKEFDAIGGQTNAFTTMENTCYHARVMDAHLATMVNILSDIFLNSVFDPLELEKERTVILQEISIVEDTPEELIHHLLNQAYWGDDPLGRSILGSRESVSRFPAEALTGFFGRLYQPDRIVVAAAGNVTHEPFVDLIGPLFASIRTGNGLPARRAPRVAPVTACQAKELEQVHICLGTPGISVTDPRRFAFSLLNTILGGNMSSRLFQEVREKRGLAYAVYSFNAAYVDTGMTGAYAGVDPHNVAETVRLMLREMGRMKEGDFTASMLADAKEYIKGNLLLSAESVDSQMVRLAQSEIHFNRYVPLSEVIAKVEAVGEGDVAGLAQELFVADRLALALLGPVEENPDAYRDLLQI